MKNFTDLLEKHVNPNEAYTENGAKMFKTTESKVLDLFSKVGSLRSRTEKEIVYMFEDAYNESPTLAVKTLFYTRDIRGGLGERRTFRIILKWLAIEHPEAVIKNIAAIPEFGRWDDVFELEDTSCENAMYDLLFNQLSTDFSKMKSGETGISLLAKWLPSVGASSKKTRERAARMYKAFGIDKNEYKSVLKLLRQTLDVVEGRMSRNEWEEIAYSAVPSKAFMNYNKAFRRHSPERFETFVEKVEKGAEKVNAGAIFPYEIFEKAGLTHKYNREKRTFTMDRYSKELQLQWDALPNYVHGENNVLIMADTSGSMSGTPINVALSLVVYFAERNRGVWKDKFITFSKNPTFVTLRGETLVEKVRCIETIISNTDLEKALRLILNTAVENNLKQEDFPKSLIIISDGEFDSNATRTRATFIENIRAQFREQGYILPNIISWNVASRTDTYLTTFADNGIQLVSGASQSVFKDLFKNIGLTPYEAMLNILLNDRYKDILA